MGILRTGGLGGKSGEILLPKAAGVPEEVVRRGTPQGIELKWLGPRASPLERRAGGLRRDHSPGPGWCQEGALPRGKAPFTSCVAFYLPAFQAAGAHINPPRLPAVVDPDPLEVGKPGAPGLYIGVTHAVTHRNPLPAHVTCPGHTLHPLCVPVHFSTAGPSLQ